MIIRRARPLLGTLVDIQASGVRAEAAVEAAFSAVAEIHRLMSFHEPESDVSRFNLGNTGSPVRVSPKTFHVVACAQKFSAFSEGAFDITLADKLVCQGFLPQLANHDAIDRDASYRDIILDPPFHLSSSKRLWIDLGGIAKGYAVDCAIEALHSHGVDSGLVNAGGDLRFFGGPQEIKVRDPERPTSLISLGTLESCAVATSSGYFSKTHAAQSETDALVDPKTGACVAWGESISIIAEECMTADALTKIVRLLPERAAQTLAFFNASAIQVNKQGIKAFGKYENSHGRADEKS